MSDQPKQLEDVHKGPCYPLEGKLVERNLP